MNHNIIFILGIGFVALSCAILVKIKTQKYYNVIKLYNENPRIGKPRKERRILRQRQGRIDLAIKKEKQSEK